MFETNQKNHATVISKLDAMQQKKQKAATTTKEQHKIEETIDLPLHPATLPVVKKFI